MSYFQAVQRLPEEWRLPMLELIDAVESNLRDQLAVRRQDFDELKDVVGELAEAQKRTEQRVDRLEIVVGELAEAQKRTEQRLEHLEIVVGELAEAQKRTEQRVEELAEAQKRTEQRVEELAEAQKRTEQRLERLEVVVGEVVEIQRRHTDRLGQLIGHNLERRYRENAGVYFGRWLRPVEVVSPNDLRDRLAAYLSADEIEEVMRLDVLVHGQARQAPDAPEIWLAVEVSSVVDRVDVERAHRRADLLRRAGCRAIAVVAGESLTEGAAEAVQTASVAVLQDGRDQGWDQVLREVA